MSSFSKNIWRSIKGHISRFLALFAIVALGAGVFAGLRMFVPDMIHSADTIYDEDRLIDFRIVSTLGIVEEDVEAVLETDGVEGAKPIILNEIALANPEKSLQISLEGIDMEQVRDFEAALAKASSETEQTRIKEEQFPNYVNRLTLLDGRFPQNPGEIVISNTDNNVQVGDNFSVTQVVGQDSIDKYLKVKKFEIVGIIKSPEFILDDYGVSPDTGKTITNYAYTGFNTYKETDVYTDLFVTAENTREELSFSPEYTEAAAPTLHNLKLLGQKRQKLRTEEVKNDAQDKVDEGQEELDEAKAKAEKELADAEQELKDAEQELKDGRKKISDGEVELQDGWNTYYKEKKDAEQKLADAYQELLDGEALIEENREKLEEGLKKLPELKAQRASIEDALEEIAQGRGALRQLEQLQDQKSEILNKISEGEEGINQLEAGIAQTEAEIERIQAAIDALSGNAHNATSSFVLSSSPLEEPGDGEGENPSVDPENPDEGENPPVDPENPGEGEDPPVNPSEPSVEEQLAELQQALAAAQGFLASLQEQKSQAEAQLESGRAEAEGYLAQINAGIAEIESLNISEAQLNAGEAEALDGLQQIDDAIAQIQDGAAQLDEAIEELEDGWRSYYENKALAEQEFIDARQKLIDSRKTLNKAKADLAKGEQEYQDGLKEFEEQKVKAEDDIAAAQNKLDEAREEINDIDDAKWYILSRAANPTYATYEANAQRMEQITNIFPIFFFLVAALVSLTTMTRMVESERIEIGTYKALGYTNGAIALKYLAFAGLASVLGAGIGIAVGIYVMPKVIWQSYSVIYTNVEFLVEPHAKDMIIAFVASVSIALIATFSAVRISLRERPSALMLPRAPKPGKRIFLERITPIWNRMHFTAKVTARNLFRYKKRMIMTVIGIAGCTALLITGFGIKDALGDFVTRQFDNIYLYNEIIGVDTGADPQSKTADKNSMAARAMKEQYPEGKWAFFANVAAIASNPDGDPEDIPFTVGGETARTGNSVQAQLRNAEASNIDASEEKSGIIRDTAIIVPEDGANLSNFYNLLDYKTLEPINLQANEVAMTEKLAENLLIKPGDTFMLSLGEGEEEIEVTLDKIVHYYIGNAIFMRQDAYTSIFDEAAEYNIILNYSEDISDRAKISNKLNESPAITSITFPEDLTTNYTNLTDSLDMLIILVIFVSGSLAFIVLFNLTNINIEERNSEIATIKVLGFFNKEVNSYVFRETFILSVMGTILGIPLGYLLCTFIMRSAEIDDLMFIRQISPLSYFLSVAITLVFTLIVIVFMSYKLKKIDMAASLKAVD